MISGKIEHENDGWKQNDWKVDGWKQNLNETAVMMDGKGIVN